MLWASSGGNYSKDNIIVTDKWFDAIIEGNNTITKNLKVNYHVGAIYQDNKYDETDENSHGLNIANKFSMNFATAPSVNSNFNRGANTSCFWTVKSIIQRCYLP